MGKITDRLTHVSRPILHCSDAVERTFSQRRRSVGKTADVPSFLFPIPYTSFKSFLPLPIPSRSPQSKILWCSDPKVYRRHCVQHSAYKNTAQQQWRHCSPRHQEFLFARLVRGIKQFADIFLQILTSETIKIWRFRTFHLLILDQYVPRWALSEFCSPQPMPGAGTLQQSPSSSETYWRHRLCVRVVFYVYCRIKALNVYNVKR